MEDAIFRGHLALVTMLLAFLTPAIGALGAMLRNERLEPPPRRVNRPHFSARRRTSR